MSFFQSVVLPLIPSSGSRYRCIIASGSGGPRVKGEPAAILLMEVGPTLFYTEALNTATDS